MYTYILKYIWSPAVWTVRATGGTVILSFSNAMRGTSSASPIIFFISGTDMTFDEGLLGMSGGVDFLFAAVWFLLLFFAIVPLSLLPIDLQSLVNVACRRGVARGGDLHPTERKHH